jgi:uncharacterized protein YdgA (DUF945 family)
MTMRLRPLVAATAAVLLLQSPAIAAPVAAPAAAKAKPAKAAKPAKRESDAERMFQRVVNEMTANIDPAAHPGATLEKIAATKFTPETSALLVKYLGTAKLLELQKVTHADGSMTYNLGTPSIDNKLESGQLKAAPLAAVVKINQAGTAYTSQGHWPNIAFIDKTTTISLDKFAFATDMTRGPHDSWLGSMWYTLDSFAVTPVGKPSAFLMGGIRADMSAKAQGQIAEIVIDTVVQSIQVMGQDAGSLKLAFRITGLDLATMKKFNQEMRAAQGDKSKADKQRLAALFGELAHSGATVHLDQLGWTYKGHSLSVNGSIGFAAGAKGATIEETLKQVEGKLNVRIPVALVKEVTRAVAKNMPMGQPGQPVSEQQREQQAAMLGDMAIGKMLGGGFFRMDGEVLVSDVAFKDGKLTLNGMVMDLPKPAQPAPEATVKPKQ